jgi:hypothetical protein
MWNNITLQKLAVGLVLLVGFTALYTHTRTEVHTFDALSYTQDIENKPFIELYHPHHLLYGPVGRVAYEVAQELGYAGRADMPVQALNALAGALGVILLWRFGGGFTGKRWLPLPIAILAGLSYAYWLYAGEVEVYTFAAAFLILALLILTLIEQAPTPRNAIFLGLAHAGAIMFHQTNALFLVPVSLFLVASKPARRLTFPYGAVLGLAVGIPYLLVGFSSGFRSLDDFYTWLTDYAQQGTWGGYLSLDHRDALQDGLLNSISLDNNLALAFYVLMLLSVGIGIRQWWRTGRPWMVFSAAWLLLYGGFFWWWEPWNIEFWIGLLPLWGLLMMVGLTSSQRYGQIIAGAAAVLAVLFFGQHYDPIRDNANAESDYYRQIVEGLNPHLENTDLVVTRGNILDLYLPFYAGHPASNVLSMREIQQSGGNSSDVLLPQLNHAYQRGQIIYIDSILLEEPQEPQRNPFGLSAEFIETLRAEFPLTQAASTGFYSIGQRAPVDTTSWSFEEQLNGWLEFGTSNPHFEAGKGWCITGGGDPWLESPPLRLDAARFGTIAIQMEIDQPAEYGQLFWRHKSEGLDEARSLRFPLEVGSQEYKLELAEEPGWDGEIVFLRFDPIPENLDIKACIQGIEFSED